MWWKLWTVWLVVMTVLTFSVYALDKRKAVKHKWRTPESVLLGLGFFGGGYGALAAMYLTRHKTKKWYFYVVNILGALWQFCLLVYFIILVQ